MNADPATPALKERRGRTLARHIRRLETAIAQREALDRRFVWYRLAALLGGALLALAVGVSAPRGWAWAALAAALLGFGLVVARHRRLDRSLQRFRLSREYARQQVARMELDWPALPAALPVDPGALAAHPFAPDLNLAGERSLHHLLDTALSLGGSRRLREWLLDAAPDAARIAARQARLHELIARPAFRRRLWLEGHAGLSAGQPQRWDADRLLPWLAQHPGGMALRGPLILLAGLALASAFLFLMQFTAGWPSYWLVSFGIYALVYLSRFRLMEDVFGEAYDLAKILTPLRAVLLYLEKYPYAPGSGLGELAAPFCTRPLPSRLLRSLAGIASAASLRGNPPLWLMINAVLPWDVYFAYRLDQAKQALSGRLPQWLAHWYELEAFNALAEYAYLNPPAVFPTLLAPQSPGPVLRARQLGHPLIPAGERVCNDFQIDALGELALVTGSNMSGKSTFLRTLGINLALAYAGGPVQAQALETRLFRLFTCINVSDSLSDGISYFYAEVRRLKLLLDALAAPHPYPLFFLIDEIFRGTNNRERQVGSRAYVTALAGQHGVGLISTHDLELVHLADELGAVRNYHFREDILDDRMVFDYLLHPGPSPTTNALRIMAIEGLPVHPETPVLNELIGSLSQDASLETYHDYLEEKYLGSSSGGA